MKIRRIKKANRKTIQPQVGIFDFTYELQQESRGKFLFNGQPMEGELFPRIRNNEDSGQYIKMD